MSATLSVNRSYTATVLRETVLDAWGMLEAGAYAHWYAAYGVEEESLRDSFMHLAQIYHEYRELTLS